tara:strand:+ start:197 stop:742 length:546 start_codon:yes stop_codon:yes gene_type:complete
MVRFILIYFYLIVVRVFRIAFRPFITGDTNYLSTPVLTIRQILNDPIVQEYSHFVDIGCGESIVAFYVRLILKKTVVVTDLQPYFLRLAKVTKRLFFVSDVDVLDELSANSSINGVYFCVWTSWSNENQHQFLSQIQSTVPKGSMLITVSHALGHPAFQCLKSTSFRFAWGHASVYYYKHD